MRFLWQQIASTLVSEILCESAFDGIVLDTEHGVFNLENIYSCIQVITSRNKKCLVRVTEINKTLVRTCLDSGANGIIFSTISTEEQCENIIDICFYPPKGRRGLGLVRQNFWGKKELTKNKPIIIIQIENSQGIINLETLKKYDFEYYLIGPYDLSLSLGYPGDFQNEIFRKSIQRFNEIIPDNKKGFHIVKNINDNFDLYKKYGFIAFGLDTLMLIDTVNSINTFGGEK